MHVTTLSGALSGVSAHIVHIEVRIRRKGFPGFHMVGLADTAVRESKVRVLSALEHAGYPLAESSITVNLAPADLPKSGSALDLALAVGLLGAAGVLPPSELASHIFLGELGLGGSLRPVSGVLPCALCARREGLRAIVVPVENASEARLVERLDARGAPDLASVVRHLTGAGELPVQGPERAAAARPEPPDMAHVRGQEPAKASMEVAAAGGHNVLLTGPPGAGKTMLARAFGGILPPLTEEEALETASIYSAAGLLSRAGSLPMTRPLRAPHHSVSHAGLVGGGSSPRPGEVSLAHNGVLFLDEMPEFGAHALDLLREPMEDGYVTVVRCQGATRFPARFSLVGAMNPCRCGLGGRPGADCRCSFEERRRYASRISGPLADRIDIRVEVPALSYRQITHGKGCETSARIRRRVVRAREIQVRRMRRLGLAGRSNAAIPAQELENLCLLDAGSRTHLERVMDRLGLTARGYSRLLRVARTVADLEGCEAVGVHHLTQAVHHTRPATGTDGR